MGMAKDYTVVLEVEGEHDPLSFVFAVAIRHLFINVKFGQGN